MLPIQCADIEVEIVTVGIDCPSPAGLQLSAVVVVVVVCMQEAGWLHEDQVAASKGLWWIRISSVTDPGRGRED